MKISRYIIIAAAIVAGLAVAAWFLRDGLIQRFSNPLLQDYGISIVDVSLDALAPSDASISYLELVHEKGTTIAIEGLTLPFAATSKRLKTFSARKVSVITATRTDGEAFEIAELIRQVLSLPATLEDSVILIDEFNLSPYPPVRDVRWEIMDEKQVLDGTVNEISMRATTARRDPENHSVAFSITAEPDATGGNGFSADLHDSGTLLTLSGNSSIHLPIWQTAAKLVGMIPAELDIVSGTAGVSLEILIPNDPAQTPTLAASLSPSSELALEYNSGEGDSASMIVHSAGDTEVSATFPETDWSVRLPQASLTISYGDWSNIPLVLDTAVCSTGPTCAMKTCVTIKNANLPVGTVAAAEFFAAETVHFLDSGVRFEVQPGATFKIEELSDEALKLDRVQVRLASTAALELADSGWQLSADSLDMQVEALSLADTIAVSMPLYLDKISVAQNDGSLTFQSGVYAPSSQATWSNRIIALPGVKGGISLQGGNAAADLKTVGLHAEAAIEARHNIDSATGHASIVNATVSLGKQSLSDRISPWTEDLDIVAGTVSLSMSADWVQKKASPALSGSATVAAEDLAGYFGDTVLTGFSTELKTGYEDGAGFHSEPSTLTTALVEVGVPVNNLRASYLLNLNKLSADIDDVQMSAFGGTVTAEPFSFHTDRPVNTLILNAESLDLTELLSLKEFEAIDIAGSIGATLPITIEGDTITIVGGTLTGDPPGGVIRYVTASPLDGSDVSSLGFAKRVLSNFEFDTLASDVNLSNEGDLILKLRLTGRNPDLDEKRPVVLNLGVENNIPQMLRSLRAARAVEDVLERRLSR